MTAKIDGTNGLLQQYDYQVSTTGFSYTFAAGTTNLVMNPAGTLATGTITMPAAPADGMTITFSSSQIITALTVAGNTGQSIVGQPTSLTAGGAATFVYRLSNTTWYTQVNTNISGSSAPVLNVYATPGTWTKPATVKAIQVTVVAGGGVGGTGGTGSPGPGLGGGGAAGGGASIRNYPAPTLPGPQPYTVGGSAAASSFGVAPATVVSATAGGGVGAAGGVGSGGQQNFGGSAAPKITTSPTLGGAAGLPGASSVFGGGGAGGNPSGTPGNNPAPARGATGGAYGGGGGGGAAGNTGGWTGASGGDGGAGVVIVEEFY